MIQIGLGVRLQAAAAVLAFLCALPLPAVPQTPAPVPPAACAGGEAERLRAGAIVHFRRGEHDAGERLATRLTSLCPDDVEAWELLATTRFLLDDRLGALRAWNRVGRPRLARMAPTPVARIPARRIDQALGTRPGDVLTVESLRAAERRLRLIPSLLDVRVGYRPLEGGDAELTAQLVEREVLPRGWIGLMGVGVRWAVADLFRIEAASPLRQGELWSVEERRRGAWRRGEAGVEVPLPATLGTWEVTAARETGWFRSEAAAAGVPDFRQRRRSLSIGATRWVDPLILGRVEAGVDRWREGENGAERETGEASAGGEARPWLGAALELYPVEGPAAGRAALRLAVRRWSGGAAAEAFGTLRVELVARWEPDGAPFGGRVRAGVAEASRHAPRTLWSRVGARAPAGILLRGHAPFLPGPEPRALRAAPRVVHGGAELVRWLFEPGSVRVGVGGFVDGARLPREHDLDTPGLLVDAGGGLRLRFSAIGEFRADLGRDLRGGHTVGSLEWVPPWPGWSDR